MANLSVLLMSALQPAAGWRAGRERDRELAAGPPEGLGARLLALEAADPRYSLEQINGQRVYRRRALTWHAPDPHRHCEVFVGRLPHDCFEDELVPLLKLAGEIYEFRLMINFSGWNRGYAFVMYTNEADAKNAIRMFDRYAIRPNWQLGVVPSSNNCRLIVSRISMSMPSCDLVQLLYTLTEDVKEVRIRRTPATCSAIVEYKSHRGAAMARKALVASAAAWGGGVRPLVDWAEPECQQLLRGYRELGVWTPEEGVQIVNIPEVPATNSPGPLALVSPAPTYTLEPRSQARRLRLIQEAERSATSSLEGYGTIPDTPAGDIWAPVSQSAPQRSPLRHSSDFDPWTTPLPFARGALDMARALAALNIYDKA